MGGVARRPHMGARPLRWKKIEIGMTIPCLVLGENDGSSGR